MNTKNENIIAGLHLLIERMEREINGLREANQIYENALNDRTQDIISLKKELGIAHDLLGVRENPPHPVNFPVM